MMPQRVTAHRDAAEAASPTARTEVPARLELGLAALLLPTVLFVSKANSIMLDNTVDLPYRPKTVAVFLTGCALTAGLLLPAYLWARRRAWCRGAVRTATFLGLSVLLWGLARSATDGRLHNFTALMGVDDALGLLAALVAVRAPFWLLTRVSAWVGPALLVYGVAIHLSRMPAIEWQGDPASGAGGSRAAAASPEAPPGNVYHLILDAFQREAFDVLRERNPALELPGFIYYNRFLSQYAMTQQSIPSMLAGRTYRSGESFHEWYSAALEDGLWRRLRAAGIAPHLYPYFARHCPPGVACRPASSLGPSPTIATIDWWFLGLLPRSGELLLTRPLADLSVADTLGGSRVLAPFQISRVVLPFMRRLDAVEASGGEAAYSLLNFERVLAEEDERPARGQYVFWHGLLPHPPLALNCDCRILPPPHKGGVPQYLDQAECGLRLVQRLVDRLRALGRYEDALIVVHADHGATSQQSKPFFDTVGQRFRDSPLLQWRARDESITSKQWSPRQVAYLSGALLLVKFPGARDFSVSAAPASMVDIAPTILAHVGASYEGLDGMPLQQLPADLEREAVFYAAMYDFKITGGYPTYGQFDRYVLGPQGWTFDGHMPATP